MPTDTPHPHPTTIPQSIYLVRRLFVSFWQVVSLLLLPVGFHFLHHLVVVYHFQPYHHLHPPHLRPP